MTDYFSYPYTTNIDVISKRKVDFPAVTVCNMNPLRRSELVGTRLQGIVEVDGGFNVDGDDAWFWDFSSEFYDTWYDNWTWVEEDQTEGTPTGDPTEGPQQTTGDPTPSADTRRRRAA